MCVLIGSSDKVTYVYSKVRKADTGLIIVLGSNPIEHLLRLPMVSSYHVVTI